MSLPSYPRYKNSGVEWLGEVPEDWAVLRLRFLADINPRKSELNEVSRELLVSFLPMEGIGDDGALDLTQERTLADVEIGYTYFRNGDIVIAKITPCFENGKGALIRGLTNSIGFGTTELIVVRSNVRKASGDFLHWLFCSGPFRQLGAAEMYGAGGQKRVPDRFVRNLPVALPALDEQIEISEFLKREAAKIDDLIDEQQRLTELLKEKRQAVVSHAVTNGLNPDAHMKDSGIEWIGEVPESWGRPVKLRDLAADRRHSFVNGPFGSDLLTSELFSNGVPVIYVRDVKHTGYVRVSESFVTPEKAGRLAFCNVLPGDVLIGKVGDPPGVAAIYPNGEPEGIVTQDVIRLRLDRRRSDPRYICWLLNSVYGQTLVKHISVESTRTRIGLGEFKQLQYFIPPLQEQQTIASFLAAKTAHIDDLVSEADRIIDLLQERRTALISAAVTGKIDVRRVASASAPKKKPYSTGFARQLLAAEILHHCHDDPTMGRVKLQKLIHLCEHVAEIDEIAANYQRKAAGPFDNKVMFGIASGLAKQGWFSEVREAGRTVYRPLDAVGGHKKYLAQWESKLPGIHYVLSLLGTATTQQCEIVSTLYAAWNDLLIEGRSPSDVEIIHEASAPDCWHESKANIAPDKWVTALQWMREKKLVPSGWGQHTSHKVDPLAGQGAARQSGTRQR